MVSLKGRVSEIIKTERNGLCLFHLDTPTKGAIRQSNGKVLCHGALSRISVAMPVELSGEWVDGTLEVSDYKFTWISNNATAEFLVKNCKGVGKTTAKEICAFYGSKLFSMNRTELTLSLQENFKKLNLQIIDNIVNELFQNKEVLYALEKIFSQMNVDYSSILDIYTVYGDESVKKIKENPYKIGMEFGIPLTVIDLIAYSFDIKAFDFMRIEGIISYLLSYAASSGHTYMDAGKLAESVSNSSEFSRYHEKIPTILVSSTVLLSKKIVLDEGKVAYASLLFAERDIAKRLQVLKAFESHIQVTDEEIDEVAKELNFHFGKDQRHSFKALETGGVNVLTGGPGTGKTTTINGFVAYYKKKNPGAVIAFCAPTGRAAKRLSESINQKALTIHKLLDYTPFDKDHSACKNQANPIEADLIIVDEMSMVEAELMAKLVAAIKNGTRLLLVGDENQLPSIGAGNVFHDIIHSGQFPVYRLEENFRQANGGTIHENSKRILAGKMPLHTDDFQMFKAKDEADAYKALCYFMGRFYDKDDPFKTQLIEPSTKGVAGTFKMNHYIHTKLIHDGIENVSPQPMVGDKIIFTTTNYEAGYINGDIGIIQGITCDEVIVWNDSETLRLPISAMHDMMLAYAYTIHKSQGSENEIVIIYLPEEMKHMMTRSLFYTAVTRAKDYVCVIHTGDALRTCIRNVSDRKRNTRLQEFLEKTA